MKSTRKYVLLGLIGCSLIVSFLVLYKQPIEPFPDSSEVVAITVTYEYGASRNITDKEQIEKIVTVLDGAYTKFIKIWSVNDTPTNVYNYITLNVNLNDNEQNIKVYLFQKLGDTYLEIPYDGIYRLKNSALTDIKRI